MLKRKSLASALVVLSLIFANFAPAQADSNTLGIGVDVLPASGNTETGSSMGADGSLWFIIPPGKSGTRSIRINSIATVPMKMTTSVGYGLYKNGEAAFDETQKSPATAWASFSATNFSLGSKASKVISVTFNIPNTTAIGTNLATIFITGSALNQVKSSSAFSVPGAARVAIPVFIGVGTAEQISVNFKINHTIIKNSNGNRFAYINLENTGKTPVAPSGSIRVQSTVDGIKIDAPIKIQSSTIVPGESKDLIVLIPKFIPNGDWIFKEVLQQGPVQETADVNVSLTAPSIFTTMNLLRLIAFIFSLSVFYFCLLYFRKRRTGQSQKFSLPRFNLKKLALTKSKSAREAELDAYIAEINARIEMEDARRKKRATKKPVKKPAVKKSAKKTAKKPAKKVMKKVAKKLPAKKSAAKKVVKKKAVVRR